MTTNDGQTAPGNGPERPQDGPEGGSGASGAPQGTQDGQTADSGGQDQDAATFPASYVKELRDEAAKARLKGKRADSLASKLITSMASATGRLADPTDLPFSEALLDDEGMPDEAKVIAAIDDLLKRKPHLASRKPSGDVGQGVTNGTSKEFSLADMLRAGAGS